MSMWEVSEWTTFDCGKRSKSYMIDNNEKSFRTDSYEDAEWLAGALNHADALIQAMIVLSAGTKQK